MSEHATIEHGNLQGRIERACTNITDNWDAMLEEVTTPGVWRPKGGQTAAPASTPPGKWPARPVRGQRGHTPAGAIRSDDDPSHADTPRTVQIVSIRTEIARTLRSWCQVIVETHDVEHGTPSGTDVPGMVAFVKRWAPRMAEHDAGPDLLSELDDCATAVLHVTQPERDTSMYLGTCPLEHTDPNTGNGKVCGGSVRTLDPDQSRFPDEQAEARCKRCGTVAVADWWEREMNPDATRQTDTWASRALTTDQVILLAWRDYGRRLTRSGVSKFVKRHDVKAIDPTQQQHTYRLGDIVAALTQRHTA